MHGVVHAKRLPQGLVQTGISETGPKTAPQKATPLTPPVTSTGRIKPKSIEVLGLYRKRSGEMSFEEAGES